MRRKFILLCTTSAVVLLWLAGYLSSMRAGTAFAIYNLTFSSNASGDVAKGVTRNASNGSNLAEECSSVFPGLLYGQWEPRGNVTERERRQMDRYLETLRAEYKIPASLQRDDGACGNVGYPGVSAARFMWFRALCDPLGPTPCCRDFQCVSSSIEDCQCPLCLDPRLPMHAELSTWRPANPGCHVRRFASKEACSLLKGTTLVFAGDSFLRHMFVALVMLLTDNFHDGALGTEIAADPAVRKKCTGMYQINGLECRALLNQNRTLCGGKVETVYLEIFSALKSKFLLPVIRELTSKGKKVLLVTGIGIHDDYFSLLVWVQFAQPVVEYFAKTAGNNGSVPVAQNVTANRRWPKMIWAGAHAPNLLKMPYAAMRQSYAGVQYYNFEMFKRMGQYGIPVLDTFNMTAPLHSVDGTHYGYGANMLKVQFLLNWVLERKKRKEW